MFSRARLAVFVDGCYWHGCPKHFKPPTTNAVYWSAKIEGNRARDAIVDAELCAAGWHVLRIWEHVAAEAAAVRILDALGLNVSCEQSSMIAVVDREHLLPHSERAGP